MEELEKINEELLNSKGYKNLQYMKENDPERLIDYPARMILTKSDNSEIIVDGDENIKKYIEQKLLRS